MNRRTFLRGMGAAAVGLPLLECMLTRAYAQSVPKRYALVFAGMGIGADQMDHETSYVASQRIVEPGHFIQPAAYGVGYQLTTPLLPLQDLREDFSVITGLRVPYATPGSGGDVPAGGAFNKFHGSVISPMLSGVRSTDQKFLVRGKTSDQYIAELHQTNVRSLVFRAQPIFYLDTTGFQGRERASYSAAGKPVEAITNLQVAFNSVFGNFAPPTDASAEDRAAFEATQRGRKSVLDLIHQKRQALLGSVGTADRARLSMHFDAIRSLEQRVQMAPPAAVVECHVPDMPREPGIGSNNPDYSHLDTNTGYSDEAYRSEVLADIIHMAFVCDVTRVANLQITAFQSHMNTAQISQSMGFLPFYADMHELGHNGDGRNRGQIPVSAMLRWHVQFYARLVAKLKATPEGDGTLLDNSAVLFIPEGGHGDSVEDPTRTNDNHSSENMAMLIAGRAGGMQPGRHINGGGAHPAQVLLGAMQRVGYQSDTLGEVSGAFSTL